MSSVRRFRDPKMQSMYEKMLKLAAERTSELYQNNGNARRGAGHRAAFWDGFSGMTLKGPTRSPHVIPLTLSHACLAAGQEFARRWKPRNGAMRGVDENGNTISANTNDPLYMTVLLIAHETFDGKRWVPLDDGTPKVKRPVQDFSLPEPYAEPEDGKNE